MFAQGLDLFANMPSSSYSAVPNLKREASMQAEDFPALSSPSSFNALSTPSFSSSTFPALSLNAAPSISAFSSAASAFDKMDFEGRSSPSPLTPCADFIDSPSSSSLSPNSTSEEEHSHTPTSVQSGESLPHPSAVFPANPPIPSNSLAAATSSSSRTSSSPNSSSTTSSSRSTKRKSACPSSQAGPSNGSRSRRKKVPVSTKARLAAQRKYDEKKRVQNRRLFDNLKESLEAAQRLLKGSDKEKEKAKRRAGAGKEEEEVKPLDDLSSREMMVKAAYSIKMLNELKATLQAKLQHLDEILEETELPSAEPSIVKMEEEGSEEFKDAMDLNTETSLTVRASSSSPACLSSASCSSLSEVESMLYSLSTLSRMYQDEANAVQAFGNKLGRPLVCSYAQYFSDCAVMGMDSSVAFVQIDRELNFKPIYDFVNSRILNHGFEIRQWLRDPFLSQFHALCFLLSGRFHYRARQSQAFALPAACSPSAETIVQSLYASPQAKTAPASSCASTFDQQQKGEAEESDLLSHPLGSCSLPADSFQALVETMKQLIAMGKERYLRELDTLRPVLMSSLPRVFASFGAVQLPFTNMNSDIPLELTPNFCAHPLYLPSYESLVAMFQLYTGKKSVVKLSRAVPSPNNRLLRANVFYSLIRHPNSNLPLAHLLMSGGTEWGEEFSKVEERVQGKRAQAQAQDLFRAYDYYQLD